MNRDSWTVICLAYIIGLLLSEILGFDPNHSWQQWLAVVGGLGFSIIAVAIVMPRRWQLWIVAGLIAIAAITYFQLRIPHPGDRDISRILERGNSRSQVVTVAGNLLTQGRLSDSQRMQFWFEVKRLQGSDRDVTGKLYVTIPSSQEINLYPGREATVTGILYQPRSQSNPGSFDFKTYLARQDAFAGLKGQTIEFKTAREPPWGLWQLRKRIVDAQVRALGDREGMLVSSTILGQRAVDLPRDLRDSFVKAGLAHILAASGFQVTLLLGVAMRVTERFSTRTRLVVGLAILGIYLGLTGIQPSVARASVMGVGALIAIVSERKVKPLGSLLLAGTILLLCEPLWIGDVGFELSFLATLGLIVTMPAIEKRLDWLPPALATAIALPLAASVWTFPLMLNAFSVVATYSIPANIIVAPLVTVISLVGMVSAIAAIVYPLAGSAIAWLLYYPTYLFIQIVQFFNHLPGSSFAVGKLPLGLMLLIYALMGLLLLHRWFQKRWRLVGLLIIVLIVVPLAYNRLNLVQVTVFATKQEPVLVIQNRGKVALINGGDASTAKYTLIPFLNQQGINQIDLAVDFAANRRETWSEIEKNIAIANYQSISNNGKISIGATEINPIDRVALQINMQKQTWLLVNESHIERSLLPKTVSVLLWSGKYLRKEWLDTVRFETAIAVARNVDEEVRQQLQQRKTRLYWTGRDGAIQWQRDRGFQTTIEIQQQETEIL